MNCALVQELHARRVSLYNNQQLLLQGEKIEVNFFTINDNDNDTITIMKMIMTVVAVVMKLTNEVDRVMIDW